MLLAAVVAPNVAGKTVAGTPQATPVPGRPAVGDCVSGLINPSWNQPAVPPVKPGVTVTSYAYPKLPIGPCGDSRTGEVVSVIGNPVKPVVTTTTDGTGTSVQIDDSNQDACAPAAFRYTGVAMDGQQPALILGTWYPASLATGAALSAPSVRQQAAGQHWLACIVYLSPPGGTAAELAAQERYELSLRQALANGHERNRLGMCFPDTDFNPSTDLPAGGCGAAHRSEAFGDGDTGAKPVARSALESSCRQLIRQVTGIADVGSDGLTVEMQAVDEQGLRILTAVIPAHSSLGCGVSVTAATRRLTGSLLAWSGRPLPWG